MSSDDEQTFLIREVVLNDHEGSGGLFTLVRRGESLTSTTLTLPSDAFSSYPDFDKLRKDDPEKERKDYDAWMAAEHTPRLNSVTNERVYLTLENGKKVSYKLSDL